MRCFLFLLPLAMVTVLAIHAQTQDISQSGPALEVLEVKWTKVERNPRLEADPLEVNERQRAMQQAQEDAVLRDTVVRTKEGVPVARIQRRPRTETPAPPPPVDQPMVKYVYRVTVRNTGTKIIRKVFWQYESYDQSTQQFVGRHAYHTHSKIRPGETKRLVAESTSPPDYTVNANGPEHTNNRVTIERIEFEDGSVWQRR